MRASSVLSKTGIVWSYSCFRVPGKVAVLFKLLSKWWQSSSVGNEIHCCPLCVRIEYEVLSHNKYYCKKFCVAWILILSARRARVWSRVKCVSTSSRPTLRYFVYLLLNLTCCSIKTCRCRLRLKCDGTRAETRFSLSAKRTSPFKLAGASVRSTADSRGVRISGSNAGYTMFRGSVKSTGYPLHSPLSPSLALPCVTMCHHVSARLYQCVAVDSLLLQNT